jgi:hypothetical protein
VGGGTYRHVAAPALEYDADHSIKLNVWSYEYPRFTLPFYYGRAEPRTALVLMLVRAHSEEVMLNPTDKEASISSAANLIDVTTGVSGSQFTVPARDGRILAGPGAE